MFLGGTSLKIKKKECIDECQNGSINYGISKTAYSCCDTDFCNARDAPGIVQIQSTLILLSRKTNVGWDMIPVKNW